MTVRSGFKVLVKGEDGEKSPIRINADDMDAYTFASAVVFATDNDPRDDSGSSPQAGELTKSNIDDETDPASTTPTAGPGILKDSQDVEFTNQAGINQPNPTRQASNRLTSTSANFSGSVARGAHV
eukprot:GHVU01163794.1.p1 GENE.GHVU01163794.1~~GHVU01163794.1.p1  ORF type:complete len:126 (+),score=12.61 GHVU01163794.1:258-635(+)